MEEYETGYDSSLLLCQVTMGSDSKRKSVSDPVGGQESTSESESKDDNKEVEGENKNSTSNAPSNKQTPIKTHTCDYPGCKAKFDRPWKLSAHRCTHTGERPYKCKVLGCDKSYTNLTHLRRHEQQTHVEKPKVPSGEAAVKSLFVCDLPGCGLLFQKKSSLKRHRLNKHEPKADGTGFKCPYCSLVFTNNNNLKSHMYTHDGILPFKCELCNHSFRKHSDITRHLRKHRVYKCSYQDCPAGPDKIFESHHELRTHLAFSHPSKYSCDSCNKVFRLKCRLTSHRLSCASNADKVYNCIMSDCNHTFKLYRNMLQHVKHKHGGPRYTCNIDNCTKSFIWKISHTKHVQKCHKAYLGIEETDEDRMTGKKIKRPRRRRKDAGKPRHSAAELFSGLSVNKYVHEQLLTKEGIDNHEELMGKVISFIDEAADEVLGGDAKNADSREDEDDDDIDIDDGEEEEEDEEEEEEEEEDEDEDSDMKDDFQADKDCDNSDNSNSCSVGIAVDNNTDNSSPPVASTPAIT